MARRRPPKKVESWPDPVYGSTLVQMVVNRLMKQGKKPLAYRICYRSMELIERETKRDPLLLLEEAIRNVTPSMQVKAKRRGGSTYQVPVPSRWSRGLHSRFDGYWPPAEVGLEKKWSLNFVMSC